MSGIAGAIDLTGQRLLSTPTLRAMANALRHRGPDAEGRARQDGAALRPTAAVVGAGEPGPPVPSTQCTPFSTPDVTSAFKAGALLP